MKHESQFTQAQKGPDSTGPTSVILTLSDGSVHEEYYPTRYLAELFVAMIPQLALDGGGMADVRAAILSPVRNTIVSPVQIWDQ